MVIKSKLAGIDINFEKNAKMIFPNYKSMYEITKELNKLLEEAINNGTNKKK